MTPTGRAGTRFAPLLSRPLLRQGQGEEVRRAVSAVVLAGETSLSSAIIAGDGVSSHDQYGRNRPCPGPTIRGCSSDFEDEQLIEEEGVWPVALL